MTNMVLTGLRGVGKTVLLDTLKPIALSKGWWWVGTDLSEAASVTEENLAIRLLTDLSIVSSSITLRRQAETGLAFSKQTETIEQPLDYEMLVTLFKQTPGLVADKLKQVLEHVWSYMSQLEKRGIIFAYDEAQNLADHTEKEQYPLSLLLDVFQSIQRKGIPFMLVLTGLPTLFPKLVEARTFAERMFRVVFLDRLGEDDSREAVVTPIKDQRAPFSFSDNTISRIYSYSAGYPYFIQFLCREVYDVWLQKTEAGEQPSANIPEIVRKLDADFFAGRWSRVTDRQRELLVVVAQLPSAEKEFTVHEVVEAAKTALARPFSSSQVNQMFGALSASGLIYKNRYSKYSFAVPLLNRFILRQIKD
jgi:hypothetical protein